MWYNGRTTTRDSRHVRMYNPGPNRLPRLQRPSVRAIRRAARERRWPNPDSAKLDGLDRDGEFGDRRHLYGSDRIAEAGGT